METLERLTEMAGIGIAHKRGGLKDGTTAGLYEAQGIFHAKLADIFSYGKAGPGPKIRFEVAFINAHPPGQGTYGGRRRPFIIQNTHGLIHSPLPMRLVSRGDLERLSERQNPAQKIERKGLELQFAAHRITPRGIQGASRFGQRMVPGNMVRTGPGMPHSHSYTGGASAHVFFQGTAEIARSLVEPRLHHAMGNLNGQAADEAVGRLYIPHILASTTAKKQLSTAHVAQRASAPQPEFKTPGQKHAELQCGL